MRRAWTTAIAMAATLTFVSVGVAQPKLGAPLLLKSAPVAEAEQVAKESVATFRANPADLRSKVPALEKALAGWSAATETETNPVIVHNGLAEQLMVKMWLNMPEAKSVAARSPRFVEDPYPHIAYLLGFYYNEVGQPDLAIKALSAGLDELKTHLEWTLAETTPALLLETGAAHNIAHLWQAAYDAYAQVLALPKGKMTAAQAKAYRGQGFSLVEMNRLDEAKAAYEQSLALEPENALAKRELAYIADLKTGGAKQVPTLDGKPFPASGAAR